MWVQVPPVAPNNKKDDMTVKLMNTLWGPEILEDNKCYVSDCTNPRDNSGNGTYHRLCSHHHALKYGMRDYHYKKYRKDYCETKDGRLGWKCTSEILFPLWQLEVDHFDGDRTNNDVSNLITLCANCHAIKTNIFRDNLKKDYRPNVQEISDRIVFYLGNKEQMRLFD
jgi:hypothetical protein